MSVTIQIVSRCLETHRAWPRTSNCGKEKLPFNRKNLWAGPIKMPLKIRWPRSNTDCSLNYAKGRYCLFIYHSFVKLCICCSSGVHPADCFQVTGEPSNQSTKIGMRWKKQEQNKNLLIFISKWTCLCICDSTWARRDYIQTGHSVTDQKPF